MIGSLVAGSAVVALPTANAAVTRTELVVESTILTLPVGTPPPGARAATVAVIVAAPAPVVNTVVVCALDTVCETGDEMTAPQVVSPAHAAVIEWEPAARFESVRVAAPVEREAVPSVDVPSEKSTGVLGAVAPAGAVHCAVSVTGWPKTDTAGVAITDRLAEAPLTVCESEAEAGG